MFARRCTVGLAATLVTVACVGGQTRGFGSNDAGTASPLDGGIVDAGESDVDSGAPDGGTPDAGPRDAGGMADGGAIDAGVVGFSCVSDAGDLVVLPSGISVPAQCLDAGCPCYDEVTVLDCPPPPCGEQVVCFGCVQFLPGEDLTQSVCQYYPRIGSVTVSLPGMPTPDGGFTAQDCDPGAPAPHTESRYPCVCESASDCPPVPGPDYPPGVFCVSLDAGQPTVCVY